MSAAPTLPTARPEQDIPACSGAIVQTEGNGGLPKATGKLMSTPGRPLSREHARDRSPPASAQKRRTEPAIDASATKKRAVHRDSCAAADAPQRPERRALRADQIDFSQDSDSGGIRLEELVGKSLLEELELNAESLTPPAIWHDEPADLEAEPVAPTIPSDEPTFAHLIFSSSSEEEAADTAAKVNTWRNIPKRARPKVADMIIEIAERATSGDPCVSVNCAGCHACNRRARAWQDFDYLFQVLMRNQESAEPSAAKTGPKVDEIIRDRIQHVKVHGWKAQVDQYLADAALRRKADLDRGQKMPVPRVLGEPASPQDADAFCRNAITNQPGAAAHALIGGVILPDSVRLREKLAEKIKPIEGQEAKVEALLELRASCLREMASRVTPEMIHALDEQLTKRAATLKPYKKKGRTGLRNEFIRDLHATRAGPALNRMAIQFLLGMAPLSVYRRYGTVSLSPRDKMNGKGEDDPRPVGAPDPFYRWCVGAGAQVFRPEVRKRLPQQYAIGVSNGAERLGKCLAFVAAQLKSLAALGPDVINAYCELLRMQCVRDMCQVHPLAGTMTLSIYTLPTTYVHDIFGALPQRYVTIDGVIQGCGIATETYCVAQEKAIHWIVKTVEAAARGKRELPCYDEPPPEDVRTFLTQWLEDHRIRQPTEESSVVVTRHYADNGVYLVTPALAEHLPALAEKCMAVKGLRYKSEWEAWSPSKVTLRDGET